ncbi:MAG: magnesium transporter, partial [Clostridia bacterium]|nr:magnesium transporter [Clostridia bacterium]
MLAGHQFREIRGALAVLAPQDIALVVEELGESERLRVFRLLPKETAAEVFVEMSPLNQEALIRIFTDNELHEVLDELYIDDTVDIIEEMPANVVKR